MWDLIVSVPDHCLSFYFGSYYSWDELLEWGGCLLKFSCLEGGLGCIFSSRLSGRCLVYVDRSRTEMTSPTPCR